ncbi:hypothetical protein [Novipirellula caenicola]|uniref:hypothetical protein n=1 Tax=Novipirellula caenicola TaxID=1536901 RepID=UPI0031EE5A32
MAIPVSFPTLASLLFSNLPSFNLLLFPVVRCIRKAIAVVVLQEVDATNELKLLTAC